MNYYRKHFLMKDFEADVSALRRPMNISYCNFLKEQLFAYRDPFRVALIRIKEVHNFKHTCTVRAQVLHYAGKEMLSTDLFFGFYVDSPSEINLYEPVLYPELISSELIKDNYSLLRNYKRQHEGLLPELKEIFGESGQKWTRYFSFLAFLIGTEDKTLFLLNYEHSVIKALGLSYEVMNKIVQGSLFFHAYLRHETLTMPPALYFNERLGFLLRQLFSSSEENWKDFQNELLSLNQLNVRLVEGKRFYSLDLAKTVLFGAAELFLLRRKNHLARAQRYEELARLRDLEHQHNAYVGNQCVSSVIDFFKWEGKFLYFHLPDDFSVRMILLLSLPQIFFNKNSDSNYERK